MQTIAPKPQIDRVLERRLSLARLLSPISDGPERTIDRKLEWFGIGLCVALYFLLRVWNLPRTLISDKFDEGVYLSLMLGAAAGKGALYRDYLLCHPPGVLWIGSRLWPILHGDIIALRWVYIGFCALVLPPVYAIARRCCGTRAALLTLFLLCTTPGLANWLGRQIYLDPPLNVPIYAALWLLLYRPRRPGFAPYVACAAGLLVGVSYLIKETALPAGIAIGVALWSMNRGEGNLPGGDRLGRDGLSGDRLSGNGLGGYRWQAFAAGLFVASCLTLGALCRIPNYYHDTFTLNANDARRWDLRVNELTAGFYALPLLLTFGVAGAWAMARQRRDRCERLLGVYAVTMMLLMFLVPQGFYWRYLTAALPACCLGAAVWWQRFMVTPHGPTARAVAWTLLVLCVGVHLASLILYRTRESIDPPAFTQARKILRAGPGPLFTLNPIWSAVSGYPLTPPTQRLIKATNHLPLTAAEIDAALAACPTVLLDHTTLHWLPPTAVAAIRARCQTVFRYGTPDQNRYVEILRHTTD